MFRLLWEIVKRDIIYIWEEGETFQLDDNVILSEPFQVVLRLLFVFVGDVLTFMSLL